MNKITVTVNVDENGDVSVSPIEAIKIRDCIALCGYLEAVIIDNAIEAVLEDQPEASPRKIKEDIIRRVSHTTRKCLTIFKERKKEEEE